MSFKDKVSQSFGKLYLIVAHDVHRSDLGIKRSITRVTIKTMCQYNIKTNQTSQVNFSVSDKHTRQEIYSSA